MKNKTMMGNFLLLLTAAIWGFAFVAQRVGAQHVGAFTFTGTRFALGAVSLVPLILFLDKRRKAIASNATEDEPEATFKQTLLPGMSVGVVLFIAVSLQQIGLGYTTAGKAGFITGLYMVIVPLIGIFLKHKIGRNAWMGVALAVVGLYLLSVNGGFSIGYGDLLVLICAFFWAIHILFIDHFSKKLNPVKFSCIQFATCSVMSLVTALIFETITIDGLSKALIPILYGGLFSVGVAYTLQVVAQKNAKPSHAAIILSMESVFGAIGGALLLGERMSSRGYFGCGLILAGIILSQIKWKPERN